MQTVSAPSSSLCILGINTHIIFQCVKTDCSHVIRSVLFRTETIYPLVRQQNEAITVLIINQFLISNFFCVQKWQKFSVSNGFLFFFDSKQNNLSLGLLVG